MPEPTPQNPQDWPEEAVEALAAGRRERGRGETLPWAELSEISKAPIRAVAKADLNALSAHLVPASRLSEVEGEREAERALREDAYRYQQAAEDRLNPEQVRAEQARAKLEEVRAVADELSRQGHGFPAATQLRAILDSSPPEPQGPRCGTCDDTREVEIFDEEGRSPSGLKPCPDCQPEQVEQGGADDFERLRAKQSDCGVCGVPGTGWLEVCEGYSVPRCPDHMESPAYQAESRLATLLSSPPHPSNPNQVTECKCPAGAPPEDWAGCPIHGHHGPSQEVTEKEVEAAALAGQVVSYGRGLNTEQAEHALVPLGLLHKLDTALQAAHRVSQPSEKS